MGTLPHGTRPKAALGPADTVIPKGRSAQGTCHATRTSSPHLGTRLAPAPVVVTVLPLTVTTADREGALARSCGRLTISTDTAVFGALVSAFTAMRPCREPTAQKKAQSRVARRGVQRRPSPRPRARTAVLEVQPSHAVGDIGPDQRAGHRDVVASSVRLTFPSQQTARAHGARVRRLGGMRGPALFRVRHMHTWGSNATMVVNGAATV